MTPPSIQSPLRKAIERGLANGSLDNELRDLGNLTIKSAADGDDIVWGLQQLGRGSAKVGEQAHALAALFQRAGGRKCPAFEVLQAKGIPELLRLFDVIDGAAQDGPANDLLFLLKILGLYGTVAGTLKIVEAVRRPIKPDDYLWSVILGTFTAAHPERELLYNSLRDPLPAGFIAVSLLDAANAVFIKGGSMVHPFDTAEGKQRLRHWLSDPDPDKFSYAHSATAALPFVGNPVRDALLDLAMNHPDSGVQIEAAWAAAKIGRPEGVRQLAKHCLNFNTAQTARRLLTELGCEDAVPLQANEPDFAALAEFSNWLAHPSELGRAPDALEIVDHRELRWPPERKPKPFWLIKYTVRDTTGLEEDDVECGLVGSDTFCFFSYKLAQRPPEDAYAVHCYWEMEQKKLIAESNVTEDAGMYENLLCQWNGPAVANARMRFVAEISPELGLAQRLVGLASATLNGDPGWVVLDGADSGWYPQAEQPPGAHDSVVLKVHLGRQLLGFTGAPDRRKFLVASKPPKPAGQIIAAYEKLLTEARHADARKRKEAFASFGPIAEHFEQYVDALLEAGRGDAVRELAELLAAKWDHPEGYAKLGQAAFKCSQPDVAEKFFVKYRHRCANYERGAAMAMLAEIWCRGGKGDAAKELMLDCLRRLLADSKTAAGTDQALFERWFQSQRAAFLKLFPGEEARLEARAIPSSTLTKGE